MAYRYIQAGDVANITAATGGVTEGALWVGNDVAGVYLNSAAAGVVVPVALEGVFSIPKKAAAASAGGQISVGDFVYATSSGAMVSLATSNKKLGVALTANTTTGSTTAVLVKLSQ